MNNMKETSFEKVGPVLVTFRGVRTVHVEFVPVRRTLVLTVREYEREDTII